MVFNVSDQRLLSSLLEDTVNKPWRPLLACRLSLAQARRLLLSFIPTVTAVMLVLGGLEETIVMFILTWMYNDLYGADEHYAVRNLLNAASFINFSYGATRAAAGSFDLNGIMKYQWLPMAGAVILTSLQMQDMSDQEGDAQRGRGRCH